MSASDWIRPVRHPELRRDEVHLWRVSLVEPPLARQTLVDALSPEERARAERFAFARHRDRFVSCRGMLRQILGAYLGVPPGDLRFAYGAHGKPRLDGPDASPTLEFNLSHSEGLAVYALSAGDPLGVDIECARGMGDAETIAKRYFSSRESGALSALSPAERPQAFLRCWTRKEAWLKATGAGLADGLDRVEVSFLPGEAPRVLAVGEEPLDPARWVLHDLAPAPGCIGALAVDRGVAPRAAIASVPVFPRAVPFAPVDPERPRAADVAFLSLAHPA